MTFNAAKDLPAYILLGGVILLIIWAAVYTRMQEKKDKEKETKEQNQKK